MSTKLNDIPAKIIKKFGTFLAEIRSKNHNSCHETSSFPEYLKYAETVPIYKRNDKTDKNKLKNSKG